jgi:hypothetical protein
VSTFPLLAFTLKLGQHLLIGKYSWQVVRFIYTRFGSMDVHPFTFDDFVQAFHDKVHFLGKTSLELA